MIAIWNFAANNKDSFDKDWLYEVLLGQGGLSGLAWVGYEMELVPSHGVSWG